MKLTRVDIAKELHINPLMVTELIKSGQLPIGVVHNFGKRERTIIVPERWEAWKTGQDFKVEGYQCPDLT